MRARDQERAFAAKIQESPAFVDWLLGQTKFAGTAVRIALVRSDNPWYRSKSTGIESETDILLVFERIDGLSRFALHIENKRMSDKFRPRQPQLYHERARDWMHMPKWGDYDDFEVVLIAPREFYRRNKEAADVFHRFIPHEQISEHVREFAAESVTSP